MGFLTRLFGDSGIARMRIITKDDNVIFAKARFETFGNSREEMEELFKEMFYEQYRIEVKELEIIQIIT